MEVSLQLYSINEETKKDFKEAIKKVSEIGYHGVEFAGYGGLSAEELSGLLMKNHLYSVGSHCGLDVLEDSLDEYLRYNQAIGSRYLICPWAKLDTKEEVDHLVKVLNSAAEKAGKVGIKIGYHNHDHEFNQIDGKYIMDMIAENTNNNVILELDVFWIVYAGLNPYAYIEKWDSKVELIHIKQIDQNKVNVDVADGSIDMQKVKDTARYAKYFIIEHEEFDKPVWDSIKNDFDFMNRIN